MEYLMELGGEVIGEKNDLPLVAINAEKSLLWAQELCNVASSEVASNATPSLSNLIDIDLTYKTKSGKPRIKIDKPYPALSLNVVDLGFFEGNNKTTTVYLENLGGGNLNAKIKKITVYIPDSSGKEWFKIKMKKIENDLYQITISTKLNKRNLKEFKDGKYYAIIEIKTNSFLKGFETEKILVRMDLYKGLSDIDILNEKDLEKLSVVDVELYEKTEKGLQLVKSMKADISNGYKFEFKNLDVTKEYFVSASIKVNGETYSYGSYEINRDCEDIKDIEIKLEEVKKY